MKIKITLLIILFTAALFAQRSHPNLVLTKQGVEQIRADAGKLPVLDLSIDKAKDFVQKALNAPIDVPIPKDAGGGYTHERHKQNYNEMYQAGILFQITGEEKYAKFIEAMLDKYAEMYPNLGRHPEAKKQAYGRLFWQSLNETVWLLHTIQAYDCIYDWLTPEKRELYEANIFRPMSNFFLNECRHEFDRIHNHGTWIVAATGMTGLILGDDELVQKSLYGSDLSGKGGFIAQLDKLFSPDGYYTEGGYYVRYALWPFFIFAEVIHNNLPEVKIYSHRDEILKKALNSALQVTYTNGAFIPINDGLKEKTWLSPELIFATNFVYAHYEHDPHLLAVAKLHNQVSLSGPGVMVAKALAEKEQIPEFNWKSVEYSDGPEGKQGGVAILRFGVPSDQETALLKYGTHGLSHGHFDKLQFLFYDQGREIIQDYGAARFLNVVQKWGGRYLPENTSWAKQTIAHNTVVVDMKSQYNGKRKESQKHHSDRLFFSSQNPDFQYVGAKEEHAYPGVKMRRTIAVINDEILYRPAVVDIYKIESENEHIYDLPFYYKGHLIYTNFEYEAHSTERHLMGSDNGYQHLWNEAEADVNSTSTVTWWNGKRFYSIVSNMGNTGQVFLTRIGGSDPKFNIRNEPGIMFRTKAKDQIFATILEPHGIFDPTLEFTKDSYSTFENIEVVSDNDQFTAVQISGKKGINWLLIISNTDNNISGPHTAEINNQKFTWNGAITLIKNK